MPHDPVRSIAVRPLIALAAIALAACETPAPAAPEFPEDVLAASPVQARSSDRCENVDYEGTAELGAPVFIPVEPFVGAGALPSAVTLGPWSGTLSSVLLDAPGDPTRADLLRLVHAFVEDGTGDYFFTEDRAVCAPAGPDLAECRVNDFLRIVGGTGKFSNAEGHLFNRGIITLGAPSIGPNGETVFGSLTVDIRGRVCGDGV